ncbi:RELT-like protein 1 isoform 1-T1 [Dama dama]|uniref:RELT-like protein 1 n=1 Tax=Cervus canadensis TaxID=1574408 RepID=UPI0018BD2CCD|nr:RELT-like protein 1 [Cervus canadensis]XP_043726957.1 RELT-like protein 1 [Cervus elaphus]XP_061020522.1 RELT-like protein 1 [Dama dama]
MAPRGLPGSAVLAAAVFVGGAVSSPLVASDHSGSHPLPSKTETTPSPTNNTGNGHPEYIAYALVPVFFVMGLFGVLICHLLKKKGYRCTTEAEQDVEGEKVEKIELNDSVNENSDTVGQIVQYIMKNEANVDVLAAMVADNSVCDPESPVTPSTPGSPPVSPGPLSPGGTPGKHICGHHLHTVGGPIEQDVCHRCRHKRWHFIKPTNKSREGRPRRQGEVTVLSVGRFRVTKVEPKSNQKERRSLMSVSGTDSVNGEVPGTPVKRQQSETEQQI